jgi:hypothetical protein
MSPARGAATSGRCPASPDGVVEVVAAQWFGTDALELTYERADGGGNAWTLTRIEIPVQACRWPW